jgi:hypothetical protein
VENCTWENLDVWFRSGLKNITDSDTASSREVFGAGVTANEHKYSGEEDETDKPEAIK